MNLDAVLARIPYLAPHGIEIAAEGDEVRARMPFRREVQNHVGTLHAGALFTVAETAAGVAAYRVVPDDRAFVLLRAANVRYTRRAEGDVTAHARALADGAAARATFEGTGRAQVSVRVAVAEQGGETVFEGTFEYALRPRKA